MPQRNEVRIFRKVIHHGEDDGFTSNLGQSFHKIHADVLPNSRWNREGLEETSWLEVFDLVPLADLTSTDIVLDQLGGGGNMEVSPEAV